MYIFTPPAAAGETPFTYAGMADYVKRGRSGSFRGGRSRKVGKTVTLYLFEDPGSVEVWLYNTMIGTVADDGVVWISPAIDDHGSQATTWWVQKMLTDNGHDVFVARESGRYSVAGQMFTRETENRPSFTEWRRDNSGTLADYEKAMS